MIGPPLKLVDGVRTRCPELSRPLAPAQAPFIIPLHKGPDR